MSLPAIYTTPLADQPQAAWGNSILLRLAYALGVIEPGKENYDVSPDAILEETEDAIFRLKGLDK